MTDTPPVPALNRVKLIVALDVLARKPAYRSTRTPAERVAAETGAADPGALIARLRERTLIGDDLALTPRGRALRLCISRGVGTAWKIDAAGPNESEAIALAQGWIETARVGPKALPGVQVGPAFAAALEVELGPPAAPLSLMAQAMTQTPRRRRTRA